jgi:hypothetical protein
MSNGSLVAKEKMKTDIVEETKLLKLRNWKKLATRSGAPAEIMEINLAGGGAAEAMVAKPLAERIALVPCRITEYYRLY